MWHVLHGVPHVGVCHPTYLSHVCTFPWQLFQHATSLSPEEGHTKYLYLGQLAHGEEAVRYLTKGIEILARSEGAGEVGVACELSSAYCALAEVYLTDIWYGVQKCIAMVTTSHLECRIVLRQMQGSVATSVAARPRSCRLATPKPISSWQAVC